MTSPADPQPEPGARDSEVRAVTPRLAKAIERGIFASRWLLAPMYLGLAVSLLLLVAKFAQGTIQLAVNTRTENADRLITGTLSLVDLSLMGNLVVMVMFAGYENFVSRFGEVADGKRPDWMGNVGFGALKLKLMTSIVAIAAIHVLENFMHVSDIDDRDLIWSVGILLAFVVSGVLLALMDKLGGGAH
jgi:uncharacterized protein (TIGR00645 family)